MARSSYSLRGARKLKAEINVVPYIDVMLVLLVIFMVVAPLSNPGVINLPTAERATQPPSDYIQIALQSATEITVSLEGPQHSNDQPESVSGRAAVRKKLQALHEQYPDLPLMISADKDIKYDDVIQMVSEAKRLGITRVGLATKQ